MSLEQARALFVSMKEGWLSIGSVVCGQECLLNRMLRNRKQESSDGGAHPNHVGGAGPLARRERYSSSDLLASVSS
jgi:hypothetical protein